MNSTRPWQSRSMASFFILVRKAEVMFLAVVEVAETTVSAPTRLRPASRRARTGRGLRSGPGARGGGGGEILEVAEHSRFRRAGGL